MGGSIRLAGRGVVAAAVVAGLAGLGMAAPAVASTGTVPGIGLLSPARGAAGAVPGFASGTVPLARADLGSISCPSASFCVAVGSYLDPLLAEEWNGRSWRVMPGVRGVGLADVSCTSARFCMAVAGTTTWRWNGRKWKAVPTPPGVSLFRISCLSASFCMATGGGNKSCLTGAVWHGTAWHAMTIPGGSCFGERGNAELSQVSCASASDCIAVGQNPDGTDQELTFALAVGWNGKTWQVLDLPPTGPDVALTGVSCPDTSFCLAVGNNDTFDGDLSMAWDGTTWTELTTPPGVVSSVSCASAGSCVAVGPPLAQAQFFGFRGQAMTWNGTTWTAQAITRPENVSLSDVSCWAPSACMAAGSYTRIALPNAQPHAPGGAQLTLAEQWNGSTWQPRRTPTPGDEQEGLSGLACRSPANCMAVGAYVNGSDGQDALVEHWNGHAWKVLPAPDPGPNENVLTAISCPAFHHCIAVGYYDTGGGHQALAEQWNGSTWTTLPVPHGGVLTGVSCPAVSNCMAVGAYVPPGQSAPLALSATWDGSTWTIQASPGPGGASELSAVACPALTRCIAAGDYVVAHTVLPLSALWNGTAWTMLTTPAPGGPNAFNALASISCSGPSSCMAVGRTYHTHPLPPALAESWNGTRWTIRKIPRLKITPVVHLDAVSCPEPARCRAVGSYLTSTGSFILAEAWDGATWRRLVPLTDPSPVFNDLYAISCPTDHRCIAVGGTEIQRTLAYRWNGTRWQRLRTPTP